LRTQFDPSAKVPALDTIKAPLERLPLDMMKLVLQQLRPEDYGRLGRVSKSFRNLFSEVSSKLWYQC
jgi:hypothetical protein